MEADEQRGAGIAQSGAELLKLCGRGFFGGFDFDVDDLTADLGSFGQDFKLRGQRAVEASTVSLATTGCDDGYIFVLREKLL